MRKNLIFCTLAIMAMFGFTACDNDCDHNFIEVDYSKALVGTWTCIEPGYAEALVINIDGSVVSTGVVDGAYWESKGTIKVVNNKMTYNLENGDSYEGRFEMIAGESFSMVFDAENDIKFTYRYCENDLSDEIVGMWVCNDAISEAKGDVAIQVYSENGSGYFTGMAPDYSGYMLNFETSYKVIGDLMFRMIPEENIIEGTPVCFPSRIVYTPNGTSMGDIMTQIVYVAYTDGTVEETKTTLLRVKQDLDLTGNKYEYNNIYVSDVKGLDKEMEFMGFKLNFAEADGANIDKALKALLFNAEFPDENTIKYSCRHSGNNVVTVEAPIVVEGNKMTVKVSEVYAGLKDVDLYCFQDADNCQLHMYMPTYSFVNFFGNMQIMMMSQTEQFDATDAAAVKAIYDSVDNAVESINISFIMKVAK